MKRKSLFLFAVVLVILLSACAPGPNPMRGADAPEIEEPAGFWRGLWHGIIVPVTFVVSLFNDGVNIYEVANNGGWYNLGFILGVSAVFGGSGGSAGRARRRE